MALRLKAFSSFVLNSNKQNVAAVFIRSNHKNSPNEADESDLKKSEASDDFWFKNLTTVKDVERKLRAGDQPLNEQTDWFKSLTTKDGKDFQVSNEMSFFFKFETNV